MKIFRTAITGLTAIALMAGASPAAYADWDHDRGWHRENDGYYNRHYRPYYPHNRNTVIIEQQPVYGYAAPPPPPPGYGTRVVCYNRGGSPLPTILGGVAGGAIGSTIGHGHGRTAAIITGAILGAGVGSTYTYEDQVCTREAFETVPLGEPVYWQNNGSNYAVTPTREFNEQGRYCREYQAVATVGGRQQETYGTACRQPDGSWQVVN